MTWPFDNDTNAVEKELARASMKADRKRNVIIFLAIFLTALLLEGILSVGFAFYNANKSYNDTTPGPGSDGAAIIGTWDQCEKIRTYTDVEWAAYAPQCSASSIEHPATIGMTVKLLAPDSVFYENNFISLIDGAYPSSANEVLISDTFAERLGLSSPVGQEITFDVKVAQDGAAVKKSFSFVICGCYKNPLAALKSSYEELYTDISFLRTYNPQMENENSNIYVKLHGYNNRTDIYNRLTTISNEVGGAGVSYRLSENISLPIILGAAFVVFIVLFAAYLIIYNVFAISLGNDVRYYGLLKTLGCTPRQIKAVLYKQVNCILPPALILGLFVGYLCGYLIGPVIIGIMENMMAFYEAPPLILPIILVSLFVFLTVKISCSRSFSKTSKISPIEAIRYQPALQKKPVLPVISFTLSCVMFLSVFTLAASYDPKDAADKQMYGDFSITNQTYFYEGDKNEFQAIPNEIYSQIEKLDFVRNVDCLYVANTSPDYYGDNAEKHWMRGRVQCSGKLAEDFEQAQKSATDTIRYQYGNDIRPSIVGMDKDLLAKEAEGFNVLDGKIDLDKFSQGNYILYEPLALEGTVAKVHAGDEFAISFYDDSTDTYITKSLIVMAIVHAKPNYNAMLSSQANIILYEDTFKNVYPEYSRMIGAISIDVSDSSQYIEQENVLKDMLNEYSCYQVRFQSKADYLELFGNMKMLIGLVGGFFSLFFALIGIVNIINSFASNVLANKIIYARMQSIGMTSKQLNKMFLKQNVLTYLVGGLGSIPISVAIIYLASQTLDIHFIKVQLFFIALIITIFMMLILSTVTAMILTKVLNSKTITERLKEADI